MVIDAAKGIEARTRKLFEVCRLRDMPIITFVNKMDRETRDPFDLLDEIEKTLALDTAPLTWPIGSGREFAGTYDLRANVVRRLERGRRADRASTARTIPASRRFPMPPTPKSRRRRSNWRARRKSRSMSRPFSKAI